MRPDVSKRRFLKAAGASVAAAGLGLSATAANARRRWDVIVVGGGNAGLPTALFAAQRGAHVLIVEAAGAVGGTLFLSTGQMAAAGTKLQKSRGIEDSPQLHYDDIMRISEGTADPVILRLAVDHAAAVFDWLTDHGLQVAPEHPVTGTTHEPYSRPRYAWGSAGEARGGAQILDVLNRALQPHIDAGRIRVLASTEVTELLQAPNGGIEGVVARGDDGRRTRHYATSTVLTAGGYTADPEMYERLEGAKDYSLATYPFSRGASIRLATAVGGYARGGEKHTPLFGAVLASANYPSPMRVLARHFPGDRPPWEIFVNAAGRRYFQEDVLSHHVYERALAQQSDERCWAIFDEAIYRAAPTLAQGGFGGPWSEDDTQRAFDDGDVPMFHKADSIEQLATKAGVHPAGLAATVAEYNRAQAGGQDAFGRKHMPLPIAKAPFYAIQLQSWNLTSYAGVAADGQLRVVRRDGTPIPGLYAAGEALGVGATMGKAVCGGMAVTPALALGRLLGHQLLQFGS